MTQSQSFASDAESNLALLILQKRITDKKVKNTDSKIIDEMLENLVSMQKGFTRYAGKEYAAIRPILDHLSSQHSAILRMIDPLTLLILKRHIYGHRLMPSTAQYQEAFKAVRKAVSGEALAARFGLPNDRILPEETLSTRDEILLRNEHIEAALEHTLKSW